MEINPKHPITKELKKKLEADENDKTIKDLVQLLFDTASLTSGFTLEDPVKYASRIYKLISLGLSLDNQDEEICEPKTTEEKLPELDGEDTNKMEEVD